jgi:hypothetical protein
VISDVEKSRVRVCNQKSKMDSETGIDIAFSALMLTLGFFNLLRSPHLR